MNNIQQKQFFMECLYTALLRLIRTQPLEQIRISQLCETAGVSRMTYYRNCRSKTDILLWKLNSEFSVFLERLRSREQMTFQEMSLLFFQFWGQEDGEFVQILLSNRLTEPVIGQFFQYLENIFLCFPSRLPLPQYVRSFLAGGLWNLLREWLRSGQDVSPETLACLMVDMAGSWLETPESF